MINQLYLVINKYAQITGLALDSDPEIQQLLIITLVNTPVIRDAAGIGYAGSIYAMVEKYLQSATYDFLNDIYDKMSAAKPDIQLITSNLEGLGLIEIAEKAKKAGNGMLDIQMTLDEEIIASTNITMDWTDIETMAQNKVQALRDIDGLILPLIAKKLQARLDGQTSQIGRASCRERV